MWLIAKRSLPYSFNLITNKILNMPLYLFYKISISALIRALTLYINIYTNIFSYIQNYEKKAETRKKAHLWRILDCEATEHCCNISTPKKLK